MQSLKTIKLLSLITTLLLAANILSSEVHAQNNNSCQNTDITRIDLIRECVINNPNVCLDSNGPIWCIAICDPLSLLEQDPALTDALAEFSVALNDLTVNCPCTQQQDCANSNEICQNGVCANENNSGETISGSNESNTFTPTQPIYVNPPSVTFIPSQNIYTNPSSVNFIPTGNTFINPDSLTFVPTQNTFTNPSSSTFIPTQNAFTNPTSLTFVPTQNTFTNPTSGTFVPTQNAFTNPTSLTFVPTQNAFSTPTSHTFVPTPNYGNPQQLYGSFIPYVTGGGYLPAALGYIPAFNFGFGGLFGCSGCF